MMRIAGPRVALSALAGLACLSTLCLLQGCSGSEKGSEVAGTGPAPGSTTGRPAEADAMLKGSQNGGTGNVNPQQVQSQQQSQGNAMAEAMRQRAQHPK